MKKRMRQAGFSLTEVLMASGILMLGFLLIAGTFPVGIKLTALATERTIGLVAAKEAAAKISLYGLDPSRIPTDEFTVFNASTVDPNSITELRSFGLNSTGISLYLDDQGIYPTLGHRSWSDYLSLAAYQASQFKLRQPDGDNPFYYWTGLCKRRFGVLPRDIQVVIFVGRRTGAAVRYPRYTNPLTPGRWTASEWPVPVPIRVARTETDRNQDEAASPALTGGFHTQMRIVGTYNNDDGTNVPIVDAVAQYVKEGASIVDGSTGQVMRVLEVENLQPAAATPEWVIRLTPLSNHTATLSDDGLFAWGSLAEIGFGLPEPRTIWVMPPAIADDEFAGPSNEPPVVAGRDPCVSVYQTVLSF